ncbi:MAG: hypothetical protein E5W25_34690, partial [Mesorhizobium sp.]
MIWPLRGRGGALGLGAIHPVDITQREDEMRLVKPFAFAAVLLLSSALSAAAQSAREDIEAALTKFTDAFNSGNAAAVGQMYTED